MATDLNSRLNDPVVEFVRRLLAALRGSGMCTDLPGLFNVLKHSCRLPVQHLSEMRIFYSKLSARGQVSIPRELREKLGLRPGVRVALEHVSGTLLLQPITDTYIDSIPGSLGGPSLGAIRSIEHRRERSL
jgi:AbrB family looped-hinge helix DNA binding protein